MAGVTLTVGVPNFGDWTGGDWRGLVDLARAAEQAGVDRVLVVDHVVMGSDVGGYAWGRFPTPADGPWLEPLTVLSAMAAATSRVRLATGILIAPLRPAALLAKTVATLDVLSGGRVDLGVGVGWQEAEYAAIGQDFTARGRLLEDTIGACRALWEERPASYSSSSVSFDGIFCAPAPAQERLPVWFGGTLNDRMLRRVVELGDGWIPIMGATTEDIAAGVRRIAGATDRRIDVQAPARPVRGPDGSRDAMATMAAVPDLVAAGVTDVCVNVSSFAASVREAPAAMEALAAAFRAVTP